MRTPVEMELAMTPRHRRLFESLLRWLPRNMAIERSNGIASPILADEEGFPNDRDPFITIDAVARSALRRPDLSPLLQATDEQVQHAIDAWNGSSSELDSGG